MSLRLSLMGSSASGLSGSSSRLEATEWLEAASDMASKLSDVLPMLPSSWLRLKRVLFSPVGPRMEFSSELTVAFPWLFRRTELWVPWIKMEKLIKRQWSYVHAHKGKGIRVMVLPHDQHPPRLPLHLVDWTNSFWQLFQLVYFCKDKQVFNSRNLVLMKNTVTKSSSIIQLIFWF